VSAGADGGQGGLGASQTVLRGGERRLGPLHDFLSASIRGVASVQGLVLSPRHRIRRNWPAVHDPTVGPAAVTSLVTMVPAESAKDLFYGERSVADAPAALFNQRRPGCGLLRRVTSAFGSKALWAGRPGLLGHGLACK